MSFIKMTAIFCYGFAMIYTIFFAYSMGTVSTDYIASNQTITTTTPDTGWLGGVTGDLFTWALDVASSLNPIWLLIVLLIEEISPANLYFWLDMLILRPTGWIMSILTIEWVINKLRGI